MEKVTKDQIMQRAFGAKDRRYSFRVYIKDMICVSFIDGYEEAWHRGGILEFTPEDSLDRLFEELDTYADYDMYWGDDMMAHESRDEDDMVSWAKSHSDYLEEVIKGYEDADEGRLVFYTSKADKNDKPTYSFEYDLATKETLGDAYSNVYDKLNYRVVNKGSAYEFVEEYTDYSEDFISIAVYNSNTLDMLEKEAVNLKSRYEHISKLLKEQ